MFDFSSNPDIKQKELQTALDECLLILEQIADSEYKLGPDSKNSKVWSVWRQCQAKSRQIVLKHKHLAL